MVEWSETRDLVIVGSGAGALCAALAARVAGADVLVVEKESMLGGNSALSGGTMWVPANPLMLEAGIRDSIEDGLAYLDGCVGDAGPATSRARKLAYLTQGPRMIEFLRGQGVRMNRVRDYADYYAETPGASRRGRALQCDAFDLGELGPWGSRIPNYAPVVGYVEEFPQVVLARRTWRGFRTAVKVAARTFWGRRLRGRAIVANGAALIARLLQAALRKGVAVWPDSPVRELVVENGRVAGVRVLHDGREVAIGARHGVLLACGGFARNLEMRRQHSRQPASTDWTFANPGETGDAVQMAIGLGAATDLMDEGVWIPMTISPLGPLYVEYERGKPHSLLVDGEGRRYVDEGSNYMSFGQTIFDHHAKARAIPSWLILESRHRNRYFFAGQFPGRTPGEWIQSGFVKRADTLEGLAAACGIDAAALTQTVRRFNGFAATGVDADFRRGESLFSRNAGDPSHGPNPGLGAIERPPFYAIAVFPGDLGTFGGILTDERARVLRGDGSAIGGLFATGNATAPVMGRVYPCTGASIASTMIFGFIAAHEALGRPLS